MGSTRVVRKVNNVERSVLHWSVNTMCEFESASAVIERAVMREALRRVVEKYAYLRLRVEREENDELVFVENSPEEIDQYEIAWNDEINDNDDWQTRLNIFGSRGYTKRLFDIEVDRVAAQKYRVYFRISHVGADGRSVFTILKDLMLNLDSLVSRSKLDSVEKKTFLNIHQEVLKLSDPDKLRAEPVFVDKRHSEFGEKQVREEDTGLVERIRSSSVGHYAQLDEKQSRDLFEKCKRNGVSIQGLLSVAKMISLINETSTSSSDDSSGKFKILNSIPCDMRYYLNLNADDLIKGSALLIWVQELSKSDPIWSLAARASAEVNRQKRENEGTRSWQKILLDIDQPKACMYATSMGRVSLGDEERLKSIKIIDLRFFASTPGIEFDAADNRGKSSNIGYVHTFTYHNRFNLTFTHSFPRLSLAWGERFLNTYLTIVNMFLNGDESQPTLEDALRIIKS